MNDTNITNNLVNVELPDSAAELAQDVFDKPLTTMKDLWFLIFGGISQAAEKRRMKYQCDLDIYKKELDAKIAAIPKEKLLEPSLHIAGQALDDSRYCIDSQELRSLFSNLIASSMNKDYEDQVHPSFPKIIQQMSPIDAQMLPIFDANQQMLAVANFVIKNSDGSYRLFDQLVPEAMPINCSVKQATLSIASLQHLGLIEIPEDSSFTDKKRYERFYRTPAFLKLKEQENAPTTTADIQKHIARLTPLGISFTSVCLEPHQSVAYMSLPIRP